MLALARSVIASALVATAVLLPCAAATAASTKPSTASAAQRLALDAATIKTLEARVTADEKALKTVQSTQQNQLCSILQLHDEVSRLITQVAGLEAGKRTTVRPAATFVC